jgi:hypothetical protein
MILRIIGLICIALVLILWGAAFLLHAAQPRDDDT